MAHPRIAGGDYVRVMEPPKPRGRRLSGPQKPSERDGGSYFCLESNSGSSLHDLDLLPSLLSTGILPHFQIIYYELHHIILLASILVVKREHLFSFGCMCL
jgi:hypothetical protein